jgi:hypothetical protein
VYQVVVTEDTCTAFLEIVLDEPDLLALNITDVTPADCEGNPTGSAVLQITGGTEPYLVVMNGLAIESTILTSLVEGTYDIEIEDANGCATNSSFDIERIPCDSLDGTSVVAGSCGNIGLTFFDVVSCTPVMGATGYAWRFENANNPNENFIFTTSENSFSAYEESEIVPGITYLVTVEAMHPTLPSQQGDTCLLSFQIETANLVEPDCGRLDFAQNEIVTCTGVMNAQNYQFRFEDLLTQERFYEYTGGNEFVSLMDVDGLMPDVEYQVSIRAQYRDVWGAYGESCMIKMAAAIPTTMLTDEWCENYSIDTENDVIFVEPIQNATVYELRISGGDIESPMSIQLNQLGFPAADFDDLTKDLPYAAHARAFNGNSWTPWGAQCTIAFKGIENYKLNMHLYPNPMLTGNELNMVMKGDWTNLQIKMYNVTGFMVFESTTQTFHEIPQVISLPRLPQGLYMINATHGKETLTKRIIIQ